MMTAIYIVCWVVSVGVLVAVLAKYRALYSATLNISKAAFYDDLDAKISILSQERGELEASLGELRNTAAQAQLDAEAALRQKLAEERELETVRSEILRIGEQIKQLEPEREELRKTREHLDRTRQELGDGQRQLSEQMASLGKAQAEMASVLTKRDEALRDLRACEERLPGLRAESATLNSRVQELRNEAARLQEDLITRRQRLETIETELRALEMRRIEMEQKLSILAQQITAAEKQLASTEALVSQHQSKLQELDSELTQRQHEAEKLRREEQDLKSRIEELDRAQKKKSADLQALEAQIDSRRQRLETTETELRALEMRRIELEGKLSLLAQQIAATEKQLASTEALVRQHQSKLHELDSELARRQHEVEKLRREEQELKSRVEELGRAQKKKADELQALESQIDAGRKRLEEVRAEAASYESRAQSAARMVEDLKGQIADYQKLLDSVMKTAAQQGGYVELPIDEALKDLVQPVTLTIQPASGEKKVSEEGAFGELVSGLTEQGLHFHPRVLAAFHTSLKTSDFNQLTVLAGVSGTGKSALPRAYANVMGMHSLVVPVQPGWAGPQDLLGFFNYLERKYKATDLSRYLALFSKYAKRDLASLNHPAAGSRSGEMLLVLLDEMNLARVEYYFSEFLSRLEARPSISPDDENQRRQVAIQLETGPIQSKVVRPVLYPDANILFAGTMNEDESTQSLSDKVVDRANVLRFGAPFQFKKMAESSARAVKNARHALSRDTWEAWCSPKRAGVDAAGRLRLFDEMIPDLSATMDRLGRPFGYRVHEAMRRYILAYPRLNGSAELQTAKLALADQFEQKIIPKLRGLDTDEKAAELRALGELISRLEDGPLNQGFRSAISRPTFEWSGLDRAAK